MARTIAQIKAFIDATYPDNVTQGITAAELRDGLHQIVDATATATERSTPSINPSSMFGNPNTYIPPPYTTLDLLHLQYS
jgi:hypothetical protein